MLERLKEENTLNVYEFLVNLRKRRVLMVQTLVSATDIMYNSIERICCVITVAGTVYTCPRCCVRGDTVWKYRDFGIQTGHRCGGPGPEPVRGNYHWIPAPVSSQRHTIANKSTVVGS